MARWSQTEIEERLSVGPNSRERLRAFDTHTHYIPEPYRKALLSVGLSHPDGFHAGLPEWTVDGQLAHMDRLGIETAVLSLSSPGTVIDGLDGVALAREVNEAGALISQANPGVLGFLAFIPLHDVDAALDEIAYAFDVLGAWGVSTLSHFGGRYLGDADLAPVFEELGRRGAITLIHPTEPAALVPNVMAGWSRTMYEYFFDTTRAVINLVFSGQLRSNPGVRLLLPHGGAALPVLARRIERNVLRANAHSGQNKYPSFIGTLKECWFDLAGSSLPEQVHAVRAIASPDKILWGSDFPFTNSDFGAELCAEQRTTETTSDVEKVAILRDNARSLFADHLDGAMV